MSAPPLQTDLQATFLIGCFVPEAVMQTIRNFAARIVLGLPPVRERMSNTLTELDIAYPDSPLSGAAPHTPRGGDLPHPGERWPTSASDGNPIGAGDRPHFAVLGSAAATIALTKKFPKLVDPRAPATAAADTRWIIRPDGYVGPVAREDDIESAEAYLGAIAG